MRVSEGRLSFFLLLLMLLSITWSMEMAGWVEGLYVVEWTTLVGLTLGFLLTRREWPRGFRHLIGVLVGAPAIVYLVARFVGANLGWRDGLTILAYEFDAWLRMAVAGEAGTDTTVFVLLMAIVGWWLGYASVWMVFGTHRVWQALALTGAAMLVVVYGSPSEILPFFVLFIFCASLLAVRLYVFGQEQSWEKAKAHYDRDIDLYFLRDGGLLVTVVLVAVWILPLLSSSSLLSDLWARVEGPWHSVGDQWNRLFSGIRGYRQDYENVPFADRLALGGPIELGSDVVMWVQAEEGQYWRGTVYDKYDGSGWQNTDQLTAIITPDKYLPSEEEYELREFVRQIITPNWSGVGQVFGIGQPATVDLPVEVRYSFIDPSTGDEGDPFSAPAAVSIISSRVPIGRDRPYVVISSASIADVETLRRAGDDYPIWVSRRYLQLPPSLPQRVTELAEQIAAPHDNPYDRATAIEDYLRDSIAYNENIEAPPPDRDGIDYLLFDSHEGYCNYYASAMVVMARAVGIPSRLAVGYSGGDLDSERGQYEVREGDTHAWVEVYFPRYGWVEFEPTASEAPVARPTRDEDALRDELQDIRARQPDRDPLERDLLREELDEPYLRPLPRQGWRTVGWALVLLLISGSAGATAYWLFRRTTLKGSSEVERSYRGMGTYGRFLGVTARASQTPHEYAALLVEAVPEGTSEIRHIAAVYVQERFSRHGIGLPEEEAAREAWRRLRRSLWGKLLRRSVELGRQGVRRPLARLVRSRSRSDSGPV